MDFEPVLLDGEWRHADAESFFHAENPGTGERLSGRFPVSSWRDCDLALQSAFDASTVMRKAEPERIAAFLEAYASNIEAASETLVAAAHEETGLAVSPRLKDVELPRTIDQFRQAAATAREESWKRPTLDLGRNIRSCLGPIGPVVVFGPNNFPFAFNGVSGGDFAAAIAAGNPVIAKGHPLHPNTTRLLAEEARKAIAEVGLPKGAVQLIYQIGNESGLKLVSDKRAGATGFTGSRSAGLALKKAADAAGKPIYLEMSSINPVIFLPAALEEAGGTLARELVDSCLAGAGQFCTSPNLILLWGGITAEDFLRTVAHAFQQRTPQPLLSSTGLSQLHAGVTALVEAGAELVTGGTVAEGPGYRYNNTLLRATSAQFLSRPDELQREVFGNATLAVTVEGKDELFAMIELLEGNLTGTIYSAKSGTDDALYGVIEPALRRKVGRLLNDKMPTGVAVSPAMNHGGPFPASSQPGFTSVGVPAALTRFAVLECYDGVGDDRLPSILRNNISNPLTWRSVDGTWLRG